MSQAFIIIIIIILIIIIIIIIVIKLQLGYHPVAVVILHVHKYGKKKVGNLCREGYEYMRGI